MRNLLPLLLVLLALPACGTFENASIPVSESEQIADIAVRTLIAADTDRNGLVQGQEFRVWLILLASEAAAKYLVAPPVPATPETPEL